MEKNILFVTSTMGIARDEFKRKYLEHKAEYEKAIERIKANYKPNSELFEKETKKAKEKFDLAVDEERAKVREFVLPEVDDLRQMEYKVVEQIDTVSMGKISAIAGLPMTASELGVLQKRFAPNGEYWPTRMIADIAEKNGLSPSQFLESASLDTKLDVLSQLENQLNKLLENYNGEHRYQTEVLLCDSILMRAERIYTNGWNVEMEDIQVARRAYLQMKGKSPAEQGIALSNIFGNTTPAIKRALFFEIANDGTIDEGALKWAGLQDEFNAYKEHEHSTYMQAREGMEKTLTAKSKDEVASVADGLKENEFYNEMLKAVSESNIYVNEYLGEREEDR